MITRQHRDGSHIDDQFLASVERSATPELAVVVIVGGNGDPDQGRRASRFVPTVCRHAADRRPMRPEATFLSRTQPSATRRPRRWWRCATWMAEMTRPLQCPTP